MSGPAIYRVFGLDVAFPREVATLRSARIDGHRTPDVQVVFDHVPPFAVQETVNEDLDVASDAQGLTIQVDEVGRFRVEDGKTVVVEPYPCVSVAELDLYLAGSIMGAVLHQRAVLPFHCNAFASDHGAVLLCGDSGAGKSTLACWLESQGHALLTDDVCAITFDEDGRAMAHPGMPRLRLWDDALQAMDRTGQSACAVPWADGKFELEMSGSRARKALPVSAIYHLCEAEASDGFAIRPLHGLAAINAVTSNIYRRRLGDLAGRAPGYVRDAVQLATHTPIYRVERNWGMENFEREARSIERHASNLAHNTGDENLFIPKIERMRNI